MNSIGWQSIMGNRFISPVLIFGLILFWASCTDDSENLNGANSAADKAKANINSTSSYSDYNITVEVSSDGSEWTYTIAKKLLASGKWSKDISHLIINLQNCGEESATFSDILWATINGQPADFGTSEGSGTGCNPQEVTTNFVKFDGFPSTTTWTIVIKFDRGYEKVETNAWIKAGSSCNMGAIFGPGCPITDQCAYGQGRFFGEGYDENGSIEQWPLKNGNPTLTIGGKDYSPEETNALWDANTGQGLSEEMKAFFQLGALLISGATPAELQDEITLIENYFLGLPKVVVSECTKQSGPNTFKYDCIMLPLNEDVQDAAGVIGDWIDDNKCENLD
jgi:hypothetical protein